MLRQKLLHLLKIQIALGWQDGRMLTIFKSVTSRTFQLSNFYNEQWDTTELMNLGQSRGIITWALWKELSTPQDDNFGLAKKQNFIQVSWMRYLHSSSLDNNHWLPEEQHLIWGPWKVSYWGFGLFDLNIIIVFWKGLSSSQDDNYGCNTRGTIFTVVRSTHQGIVRIVLQFSLSFLSSYLNVDFVVMIGTEDVVNIFLQICQKGCRINIFAFFEVYRPPCSRVCYANITTQHRCKRQKETAINNPKIVYLFVIMNCKCLWC